VFRSPSDLLRKVGASQKNDGPLGDDIRFNLTFHQTRWSDDEGGRIYRHDVRACRPTAATPSAACCSGGSGAVHCPMLLIHGLLSDALLPATIARMQPASRSR
jgi:hypothetical protein